MELKDYLFAVVLFGTMFGAYAWNRRRVFAAGRTWKKLAQRFRGTLRHKGEGWIKEPYYVMTCEIEGIELTLSYDITSSGKSHTYWTRVTTPCDADLEFNIYPEGVFETIGKGLGFQDVQVEDAQYDRKFMIKAAIPAKVQKLCGSEFRRHHLMHSTARVAAEGGTLGVVRRGLVSDFDESLGLLELAVTAAKAFAPTRL